MLNNIASSCKSLVITLQSRELHYGHKIGGHAVGGHKIGGHAVGGHRVGGNSVGGHRVGGHSVLPTRVSPINDLSLSFCTTREQTSASFTFTVGTLFKSAAKNIAIEHFSMSNSS